MYWFDSCSEQSTSSSAGVNTTLLGITGIADFRGYVRRLQCGRNANATDVQVRIRLQRTTTLLTAGTSIMPTPALPDGSVASALVTTLPTAGAFSNVQLAFNTRGTSLWFATIEDEAKAFNNATAPNAQYAVNAAQTGSVAVPTDVFFGTF
jgi:hypothetical protein